MKSFAFGSLNFDRQSIPEELRDMAVWPSVDEIALGETDRDVYRRKELAIRQFLLEPDVERSRYAEKSPGCCLRIILHVGSFVVREPILRYFERISQHANQFSGALCPAVRQPSQAPEVEGPAAQDD